MSANNNALVVVSPPSPRTYVPSAADIEADMRLAKVLVASRLAPKAIDTPEKAFYIIQAGREQGVPPIRALTGINIIDGKPSRAAELMLEQFRQRGGHSKWLTNTAEKAEIWLKAPNGDEHTESFTMAEAQLAGVAGKQNWRLYPKAMLKARAISAGLRALGEANGAYDPDELGAVTNEAGEVVEYQTPPHPKPMRAADMPPPPPPPVPVNDVVDIKTGEVKTPATTEELKDFYTLATHMISGNDDEVKKWVEDTLGRPLDVDKRTKKRTLKGTSKEDLGYLATAMQNQFGPPPPSDADAPPERK